jgi:hypothetical protein
VLDPNNKLAIFFTLNGQLLGELVLEFWRIIVKHVYCLLQVEKFRLVLRWISSSQQLLWRHVLLLWQILAMIRPNHLYTTSIIVPDWDWHAFDLREERKKTGKNDPLKKTCLFDFLVVALITRLIYHKKNEKSTKFN